ncbi:MAG: hypothetical protein ACYDD1_19480, partial [Caulobacteraceae bacterium]
LSPGIYGNTESAANGDFNPTFFNKIGERRMYAAAERMAEIHPDRSAERSALRRDAATPQDTGRQVSGMILATVATQSVSASLRFLAFGPMCRFKLLTEGAQNRAHYSYTSRSPR